MHTIQVLTNLIIAGISLTYGQSLARGSQTNFQQLHGGCTGVVCPDQTRCVLEGSQVKCIDINNNNINNNNQQQHNLNTNRLSRAPRRGSITRQNPALPPSNTGRLARTGSHGFLNRGNSRTPEEAKSAPPHCFLPMNRGRCFGNFPRYFYNVNSGKCERFSFGGCGGNSNNFNNQKTCQDVCITMTSQLSTTSGGLARRPEGAINGGFFDVSNSNMGTGSSLFKPSVGNNMGVNSLFLNTNVDSSNSKAGNSIFKNNNDSGNVSTDLTSASNNIPQRCLLDVAQGTCSGTLTRFYYNPQTRQCETFIYRGCQGNQNNFLTFEECKRMCGYVKEHLNQRRRSLQSEQPSSAKGNGLTAPSGWSVGIPPQPQPFCNQAPQKGPCTGRQIRWFYHRLNKRCERFAFSGCGGNQNNFQSIQECNRACVSYHDKTSGVGEASPSMQMRNNPSATVADQFVPKAAQPPRMHRCSLMPEQGPCGKLMTKYFFNIKTSTCETFTYGGCSGNGNRFDTLEACQTNCNYYGLLVTNKPRDRLALTNDDSLVRVKRPQFCSLPSKSGRCRANLKRYFFNTTSGTCDEFMYGGCGPNENNFMSIVACQEICESSYTSNDGEVFNGNDKFFFDLPTKDKGMDILNDLSQHLSNADMMTAFQDKRIISQEGAILTNGHQDTIPSPSQTISSLDMWAAMH